MESCRDRDVRGFYGHLIGGDYLLTLILALRPNVAGINQFVMTLV
jgi:hypothetical protein